MAGIHAPTKERVYLFQSERKVEAHICQTYGDTAVLQKGVCGTYPLAVGQVR